MLRKPLSKARFFIRVSPELPRGATSVRITEELAAAHSSKPKRIATMRTRSP